MAPKYLTMERLFGSKQNLLLLFANEQSKKYMEIFLFGSLNSANQGMEYFEGPAADVLGEGNVPIDSREVLALC